jgi:hypothetical protein
MTAAVTFAPNAHYRLDPMSIARTVEPGGTVEVPLTVTCPKPVDLDAVEPLAWEWSLEAERKGRDPLKLDGRGVLSVVQRYACVEVTRPVTVDGDLAEWGELPIACARPREVSGKKAQWTGAGDCSFRIATAYDRQFVYIAVRTVDDVVALDPARKPWDQDAVQVLLDVRPDPARSANGRRTPYRDFLPLNITAGAKPGEVVGLPPRTQMPKGTKIACSRLADGLAAEVAVPVSHLDAAQKGGWKAFRLNVGVYDRDAATDGFCLLLWQPKWRRGAATGTGTFTRQ